MYRYATLFLVLVGIAPDTWAQVSNLRCQWVRTKANTTLDSLTVEPASLRWTNLPDSLRGRYRFDLTSNLLTFDPQAGWPDSVEVCYRVLPFRLGQAAYRRDVAQYDSLAFFRDPPRMARMNENREQLFATEGIQKNGSISRGVAFGNRQSVFVNGALNLQMEGKITEDVQLTAVISDQNVPFQPEGNTQQLQEFDRVFIQLDHKHGQLLAGDIVMQNEPSAFLRYYKNTQGGQLAARYEVGDHSTATTRVGAAAAKGKFTTQPIEVIEGVLGPYRLLGPNGETFIIVLANSERVYLDGKPLRRGFNYDYVIDYNQAEITLTSNVLITQFSRLRVDYEYAERNYARTILNASHHQEFDRLKVFFNHYQESDNPNNPFGLSLDTADRRTLREIGDDLELAVINGAQVVDYEEDQILYVLRDTVDPLTNVAARVYVRTFGPAPEVYRVAFSDVGAGQGDYDPVLEATNGRAFRWVGRGRGRFLPLRRIPTPNLRRMTTVGANYALREGESVYVEGALSGFDPNRFSSLDAEDNNGSALKVGYLNEGRALGNESRLNGYRWQAQFDYEMLDKFFRPVDRFRDIEFDRDWSAESPQDTADADDHLLTLGVGLTKDAFNRASYRMRWRNKGETVSGMQHQVAVAQRWGAVQWLSEGFLMRNDRPDVRSDWQRLSTDISLRKGAVVPGYVFQLDQNTVTASETDSVVATAMHFTEHRVYVQSQDSARVQFNLNYSYRTDNAPQAGALARATTAHTGQALANTRLGKHQELALNFTYRDFYYEDPALRGLNEETVQGRLDWNAAFLDRHVRSELTFAAATGRELRRDFQFIPAPMPGQGTHQYIGPPDDAAARQDIRNYVEAIRPEDRNFIKIFVPTNEYIKAYTNNFNYRLHLMAPRKWIAATGWRRLASRFSSTSSWTIDKKLTAESLGARFVPFQEVPAEDLLSTQDALRATLFFNRTNPRYGLDLSNVQLRQKVLLVNGFEDRFTDEWRLNGRLNLQKLFTAQLAGFQRTRGSASDIFDNRNYTIRSREAEPQLAYQPKNTVRLNGLYAYAGKDNLLGEEAATLHTLGLDMRLSKVSVRTIEAAVRYVQIAYEGAINTPLAYEMLEALQPGRNYTWTINWQQRLTNGLQVNVNYEGRKSEGVPIVHLGRMQVSALF